MFLLKQFHVWIIYSASGFLCPVCFNSCVTELGSAHSAVCVLVTPSALPDLHRGYQIVLTIERSKSRLTLVNNSSFSCWENDSHLQPGQPSIFWICVDVLRVTECWSPSQIIPSELQGTYRWDTVESDKKQKKKAHWNLAIAKTTAV